MKIPTLKIESATAKKDVRKCMESARLDVENQRLIATDGHILAIIPAEIDDGDTTGPISVEAIKAARKSKSERIKANGSLVLDNKAEFPREDLGQYPDVDRVFKLGAADKRDESHIDVRFDARLLLRLAEAISTSCKDSLGVQLSFTRRDDGTIDDTAPILVFGKDGGKGLLMPMRN